MSHKIKLLLELRDGVFYLATSSIDTVKRFLAGLFAHFRTYNLKDIQIYHYNGAVLILVLPLVRYIWIIN